MATLTAAILVEGCNKTVADIVKDLVYKQYGLEVSARFQWESNGRDWHYNMIVENIDEKQLTLVSEYAYGIVKGIKAYIDYNGE